MLGALTDIFHSEKGLAALVLIIAATVLCTLGHMTIADWTDFAKWTFAVYVGGKTIQGGVSAIAAARVTPASSHQTTSTNNLGGVS